MTRKVSFEFEGKKYRVDSYDIDGILERSNLKMEIHNGENGASCLGLLYMRAASWEGGGIGDIPLFHENDGMSDAQRALFQPAMRVVAEHYNKR